MKEGFFTLILVVLLFVAFGTPAFADINFYGKDTGSIYYGNSGSLDGAPYYPSVMAELNLGAYRNGIAYTGNKISIGFKVPFGMYVNILDFAPSGYSSLLVHNYYAAPGSNVLDWRVDGVIEGQAGREYIYLIASTKPLDYDYLESIAANPAGYEPEDFIYATDIDSFRVVSGGTGLPSNSYSPYVQVYGTPLEVYPTYYIFPPTGSYANPYFYNYYYFPDLYVGGSYYRTRIGLNGNRFYAYPFAGSIRTNIDGFDSSGRIINNLLHIVPGGFIRGGFNLGTVNTPLGLVIHPHTPIGFHKSFENHRDDFSVEVIVNGEKQKIGQIVNNPGDPLSFFVPLQPGALINGINSFEIRVPESGGAFDIESIELVETGAQEKVDVNQPQRFPNPAGAD